MATETKLLTYGGKEIFNFITRIYSYEKVTTKPPCYKLDTLRIRTGEIKIEANHEEKNITINGTKYFTEKLPGYTYKKMKGNRIGVSDFYSFVQFLKEGQTSKNVFHNTIENLLLHLTKNEFTVIYN